MHFDMAQRSRGIHTTATDIAGSCWCFETSWVSCAERRWLLTHWGTRAWPISVDILVNNSTCLLYGQYCVLVNSLSASHTISSGLEIKMELVIERNLAVGETNGAYQQAIDHPGVRIFGRMGRDVENPARGERPTC